MKRVTDGKKNKKISMKNKYKEKKKTDDVKSSKRRKEEIKKCTLKNIIKKFFFKLFVYVILLILLLSTLFYYKVQKNGGRIKGILTTVLGLSVENIHSVDTINILLLGISEDVTSNLADTIMVCSYNPKNQTASMISIPRDTFIGTDKAIAKGSDKINYLYSKGIEKMLKKASEITCLDIEYYVVVKTKSVIEIIDILGGVNFDVPINMNYDDPTQDLHIHLKKGMQLIDGEKAEQLLRFRHNNDGSSYPAEYGDNDFGRMKTQRAFIQETINQAINIRNVLKIEKIANTIFNNIDSNIKIEKLKPYIPYLVDFEINNIISKQLPGSSERCNDLWFFIQDKSKTEELVNSLGY